MRPRIVSRVLGILAMKPCRRYSAMSRSVATQTRLHARLHELRQCLVLSTTTSRDLTLTLSNTTQFLQLKFCQIVSKFRYKLSIYFARKSLLSPGRIPIYRDLHISNEMIHSKLNILSFVLYSNQTSLALRSLYGDVNLSFSS